MTSTSRYSDLPKHLRRYRADTFNDTYKRHGKDVAPATLASVSEPAAGAYTLDPAKVADMTAAAERGDVEKVDAWATGVFEDLDRKFPRAGGLPREVVGTLHDLVDLATAVDLARSGEVQELRDFMAATVLSLDHVAPDERERRRARIDRIVSVLNEQGVAPPGDLRSAPEWAADDPGAASPEIDRLVIRYRVRRLWDRQPSGFTFDITPNMFVMRGELGLVRVRRKDVAKLRWIISAPGHVTPLNRVLFLNDKDGLEGYFDLAGMQSKKVVKWLSAHGYPLEKVTGMKARRDPGAIWSPHHI